MFQQRAGFTIGLLSLQGSVLHGWCAAPRQDAGTRHLSEGYKGQAVIGVVGERAAGAESHCHAAVCVFMGVCVFITGESESQNKEKQIWSYEEPLDCGVVGRPF